MEIKIREKMTDALNGYLRQQANSLKHNTSALVSSESHKHDASSIQAP